MEELIHTVFDTTDKLALEWNHANKIVDQRRQESNNMLGWNEPKKPLMLTYQTQQIPRQLPFTQHKRQVDTTDASLASIPDNRVFKNT